MENSILSRVKRAWNAFQTRDPTEYDSSRYYGASHSRRPDRTRFTNGNAKTIVTSVYNRMALDVAAATIQHCKLDENGRYIETVDSGLNYCLNTEANIDQSGRAFKQDIVMTMFNEGVAAMIPTEADKDPRHNEEYDIYSMRVGTITQWWPDRVKVNVYNDVTGEKIDMIYPKRAIGIVENPFYAVMNEPNGVVKRLTRKLAILDAIDEQSGSGKLDLIIQLPYATKTKTRKQQAQDRLDDIATQLRDSPLGIAYIDGTEKVTQLNRPLENNLMKQIEYLTNLFYSQLGACQAIFDGTADEKTMNNYYNGPIEQIVTNIADECRRKFLSKPTRVSKNEDILFFRDLFKFIPVNELAEVADKMTRNEIMSKNEIRQIIGLKPSKDPKADQLINSNINQSGNTPPPQAKNAGQSNEGGKNQNGEEV